LKFAVGNSKQPIHDVKLRNGKRRRSGRGNCSAFRGSLWLAGSASEDIEEAAKALLVPLVPKPLPLEDWRLFAARTAELAVQKT
jgi:hypothetical protein